MRVGRIIDSKAEKNGGRKYYKYATDICFCALIKFFYLLSICLIIAIKESDFYEHECYSKIFTIFAQKP